MEEYSMADMFQDLDTTRRPREGKGKEAEATRQPQKEELPSTSANINQEIKKAFAEGGLQGLEEFLTTRANLKEFDYVNCATAIHLLGKQKCKNRRLVDELIQVSSQQTFRSRELSNFCYGVASGSFASKMPDFVSVQAVACIGKFTSQALSLTLWSYAKMNHRDRKLLNAVCKEIIKVRKVTVGRTVGEEVDLPSAQTLANILWSLSVLQPDEVATNEKVCLVICQDICKAMSNEGDERKHSFLPQTLAMIASSLAALNHRDDQVLGLIRERLIKTKTFRAYNEQAIGTLLVSLAAFHQPGTKAAAEVAEEEMAICKRLEQEVRYRLRDFIPAGLGNVCEAFAKLEYFSPELWERLLLEIKTRRDDSQFTPHVLAQLLFACASVNEQGIKPELASLVAKRLVAAVTRKEFKTFEHSDMIAMLDALASLRYKDETFLAKFTRALFAKRSEYKRQVATRQAVQICTALAIMDVVPDQAQLFDLLAMDACTRNVDEFTPADKVNMLWSFACLQRVDLFAELLQRFDDEDLLAPPPRVGTTGSRKLAEIALYAQQHQLPSKYLSQAMAMAAAKTAPEEEEDEALEEVAQAFRQAFDDVQQRASVCGLIMDVYVPSKRLCIEFNGPEKFFQNNGAPLGGSLFRHRLLRDEGFQVYAIPREIFASMDVAARQAEVQRLIKKQ